jgi:Tfp pilus assembly protein PilN
VINLLPPEYAVKIKFGRRNNTLRKWIFGALIAIGGLLVILAGGWLYMNKQTSNLTNQLNGTKAQLKAQNLDKVQKDAAEITGDIKVINQILGNEIRFSKLIQDIGKLMPSGTVLESLSLNKVNGALDLSVNARDYSSATQVAVNLSDPTNNLFSKVDIVNISCNNTNDQAYRCASTLKALFSSAALKNYQSVPEAKR